MAGGSLKHQTTTLQALMSLLKAYVGTGVLAMPKSFTDSGYVFGVFGTILIGILCNCCIHMLVQINELFVKPEEVSYDYEDVSRNPGQDFFLIFLLFHSLLLLPLRMAQNG